MTVTRGRLFIAVAESARLSPDGFKAMLDAELADFRATMLREHASVLAGVEALLAAEVREA